MRLLVATMNDGKLREYQRLLAAVPNLELETMASLKTRVDVEEDRNTFMGNARKKATEIAAVAGLACLADDSGLEVDALGGRPGVLSARYAGEGATDARNNEKLLEELRAVPDAERSARFRCAIVVVDAEGRELAAVDGACEGRIGDAPRGTHGFGYDPLFIPAGYEETMAELGPETKNAISHRAEAAAKLVPLLRELRNP
ncbi:MAG: RdgB/HAM1 family non-canonical purine NTP pyrophosphatase [Deltaproteobacteria bacterium]|jgi:XTP/dITP diphosphohydrolase|nr:RdgB/HAM1 family non-canonical purine NTP pyrophosphatase [Deltaproteobacteria bacterium]